MLAFSCCSFPLQHAAEGPAKSSLAASGDSQAAISLLSPQVEATSGLFTKVFQSDWTWTLLALPSPLKTGAAGSGESLQVLLHCTPMGPVLAP